MARIAFATWDGGGNVPPAIGIAQELKRRGHDVHFFGYESQRERIEARGFAFSVLERTGGFRATGLAPDRRIAELLRNVWTCPDHWEDIPAALAQHHADLLVVDFMMQGVLAACERITIPVAALVHSALAGLVPPPEAPIGAHWLSACNDMRGFLGLPPLRRLSDAWDGMLTLVTTIPELDPAFAARGALVRYVGPIFEEHPAQQWDSPWDERDERPLVLASFSTTGFWDQSSRIRNTVAALGDEPVRVLVSASNQTAPGPLPANCALLDFVPHALVLPHAAATVTHCGHGTVTASLAHGVPVVGLPNLAADQPFLAKRIEQLGAGLCLDGDAEPSAIRAAVREVMAKPAHADAARVLAASIRACPGAAGAASELERALA
jgi:UDP:flavonoid glycosyltransferase YjiC (YdhE family)